MNDCDRQGQIWETDGGAIFLVVRSYLRPTRYYAYELCHDVLILKTHHNHRNGSFGHKEGVVSMAWRESSKRWEEPGADRQRLA